MVLDEIDRERERERDRETERDRERERGGFRKMGRRQRRWGRKGKCRC